MKVIFYLADSLSPTALINHSKKENNFFNIKIKNNFLNKLSKKSTFFTNCYGYGETFSVTSSMITGKSPYKLYTDAFFLKNSFKAKNELSLFFKKKNFFNVYYTHLDITAKIVGNEYERYYKLVTENFDISIINKKKKYNFKNFFIDNNLSELGTKHENIFYFIHDTSLHDNPKIYKNCSPKNYLNGVNKLSLKFKETLDLIKYNKNSDIIYFLSDHGILLKPFDQLYFNKNLKIKDYHKFYKKNLEDEKIKFSFFIKNPTQKQNIVSNYTIPENILSYVKNNYLSQNKKELKIINNSNIIVSCRSVERSPYINLFSKLCFHNHFLYISKNKKISFNKNHPYIFWDLKKNSEIDKKYLNKKFLNIIQKYYSLKNFILKTYFFIITVIYKFIRLYTYSLFR